MANVYTMHVLWFFVFFFGFPAHTRLRASIHVGQCDSNLGRNASDQNLIIIPNPEADKIPPNSIYR